MTPNYLSEIFVRADTPYGTRVECERTSTYGLLWLQYYGAHVWNILPINIKAVQSLHEYKSLIRFWLGPTCSCHTCTALLWLMIDWSSLFRLILLLFIYTGDGAVGVTTMLRLWHCGLSLWRPVVPLADAGSSHWQLLTVLEFIPYEYQCHQIVARADMFTSFMFDSTLINEWLVGWSSLFRLMLLRNMYTGDVAPRIVFVTARGATGRYENLG